jgi:hypothetical protein
MARTSVAAPDPARDVRRAWLSCLLFLVSFVAAFATGEGLVTAFGYASGDHVPLGPALAAGLPACVVFALPCLLVVHWGRRAFRNGDPGGRAPAWLALGLSAAFLVQNLVALVATSTGA